MIYLSPEERLQNWRDFRDSLDESLSPYEHLKRVTDYWSEVPIVNYYIDDMRPDTWPTAWELIYEGEFCRSGLSYLMMKTLELSKDKKWEKKDLKLKVINDVKNKEMYMLLVVGQTYALGYSYKEVSDWKKIKKNCRIIQEY